MTYEDKASYDSTPPCATEVTFEVWCTTELTFKNFYQYVGVARCSKRELCTLRMGLWIQFLLDNDERRDGQGQKGHPYTHTHTYAHTQIHAHVHTTRISGGLIKFDSIVLTQTHARARARAHKHCDAHAATELGICS